MSNAQARDPSPEPRIGLENRIAATVSAVARGEKSAPIALLHLLLAAPDPAAVEAALAAQGESDPSRQTARDALRHLLAANPEGSRAIARILASEFDQEAQAGAIEDGLARCRQLFEWSLAEGAEASVALYSFGNPALLDAATAEVVGVLERRGVLAPARRVLEIGCGIGRFVRALAPRVAGITGTDLAPAMIEAARERCRDLPNVRLLVTPGRDLSAFEDGALDLVLAIDIMPYLYRAGFALVEAHFAEAARVLAPGGDFVILNLSYRGDLARDQADARRFAARHGFEVVCNGAAELEIWDGITFHLQKSTAAA